MPAPAMPPLAYSARARLGLIVPPTNTVNEVEWARLLPEGVSAHAHRMPLHADTESAEGAAALARDLGQAIAMLLPLTPQVIAYACTAGSMTTPVGALPDRLSHEHGLPVVTTAQAIIAALGALGLTRISVATPYHDALNAHEVHFLGAHGVEVAGIRGLGIGAGGPQEYPRIARTPLAEVAAHARKAFVPGSEALLISCTDFPTLPLIAGLEAELGVPVITSNTATLWACLGAAGIADRATVTAAGGGRLFEAR